MPPSYDAVGSAVEVSASSSDALRNGNQLHQHPRPAAVTVGEVQFPPNDEFAAWKWKAELKAIMALALPTMILTCLGQAMNVTDQIFLGHLGADELAAAALGNTYSNLMWFFLLGTTTALDTLGSQAVGGGNHAALVSWCFSAFLLTSLMVLPVMTAQFFGNVVAKYLFAQPDAIAAHVGVFCRLLIPGMWPLMWGVILTKYLQVQNVMAAPACIMVVTFFINIGLNFVFIRAFGFKGVPLATSTSRWIQCILLALAVLAYETWKTPRTDPLLQPPRMLLNSTNDDSGDGSATAGATAAAGDKGSGLGMRRSESKLQLLLARRRKWEAHEVWDYLMQQAALSLAPSVALKYLALAVPGGLMLAFEASSFDLTTVFAGRLGTVALGSHSITLMIITLTFISCPFAVATAATIRVGNLLGAGQHHTARLSGFIAIMIGAAFMAVCGMLVMVLRQDLGRVFTNEPAIISTIATIAPMAALMQLSDGIMGTAQGVLRGCGYQGLLMLYNFIGFWICGILLGFLLCFNLKLGLVGLWWGIVSGDYIVCGMNVVTFLFVDWEKEKSKAQARMQALNETMGTLVHTSADRGAEEDVENLPMLMAGSASASSVRGHSQAFQIELEPGERSARLGR